MRTLFVIGIGAGNPEHVTIQAIKALNRVDVFFMLDKGAEKAALIDLRREICARYIENHPYRFVTVPDPVRDPGAPSYREGVDEWHARRADILQRLIADELAEDGIGALLVWGDPSLYDSTLRIVDRMLANGTVAFRHEVMPGITSVQALAAAHRIALNNVGGSVHITTGRRLHANDAPHTGNVVVMLDGAQAFAAIPPADTTIYWGAYLGTAHEMLIAGPLEQTAPDILRARAAARARHGWIMDTYLLRRDGEKYRDGEK